MGKLILCSGIRTKRPYIFTITGSRVYSIEELCYYISSNIYFIDEEILSDSLIDWIGTELGLVTRAEKLKSLKEQQADSKTLLAAILCSADYFTEQEIKKLLKMVDEISELTPVKRSCIRANSHLEKGKYTEAAGEYERILNSQEALGMTPEEYGDILHNLAVAKVHIKGLKDASETFRQAYERNRKEESLRQYLYTIKLSNKLELFRDKVEEYQVSNDLSEEVILRLEQLELEAEACDGMKDIQILQKWRTEGKINDFNRKSEEMIEAWIADIRKL